VKRNFPSLAKRVFITPDKTKLKGDFLVDDDPINPKTSFQKVKATIQKKLMLKKEQRVFEDIAAGASVVVLKDITLRTYQDQDHPAA